MDSKPEKFEIKFWCLVDNKRKYLCTAFPYLEKEPMRGINYTVSLYVCKWMLNPYFNKGYNVTVDNYFTSLLLAEKFLSKNTKIADTVRKTIVKYQTEAQHWKKENYN